MRITIFGAGAVGGHLLARFAAAGADVAAVARGAQLEALRERGITLLIGDRRYAARVTATDRPQELGVQDAVIVALKASVLPHAAPQLAPLIGAATTVVFAINGIPWWYLYGLGPSRAPRPDLAFLDPEGALARTVGAERVLGCVINSANEVVEPGVVRNSPGTLNRFTLGEPDGTISARAGAVAAAIEAAGMGAPVVADLRRQIWQKLLRNLCTSPLCALTGQAIGHIGEDARLLALSDALLGEGLAVAAAAGFRFEVAPGDAFGPRRGSTHKSSMLQDIERRRPPEIDAILTATQAFARAAGIATPSIDAVAALLIDKARAMGLYAA